MKRQTLFGFLAAAMMLSSIVEAAEPSSVTVVGLADTVEADALTDAGLTVIAELVPVIVASTVSVAVTVWEPAVFSVTEKAWTPASPPVKA